jgi:hypothetical protein
MVLHRSIHCHSLRWVHAEGILQKRLELGLTRSQGLWWPRLHREGGAHLRKVWQGQQQALRRFAKELENLHRKHIGGAAVE